MRELYSSADFDRVVNSGNAVVIIYSSGCGACHNYLYQAELLGEPSVPLYKIEFHVDRDYFRQCGVRLFPTTLIIDDAKGFVKIEGNDIEALKAVAFQTNGQYRSY